MQVKFMHTQKYIHPPGKPIQLKMTTPTESVLFQRNGNIGIIKLNNPPVNGIGHSVRSGILNFLSIALADPAIDGIVITGTDRLFSAGADIREFGSTNAFRQPILPDVIAAVEQSTKPVVAGIVGTCLGAGLELAMGCHYRVVEKNALLGLPETKIGLIPGAGGTQRLPRLVGLEKSLSMMLTGDMVTGSSLQSTLLVDEITDGNVVDRAVALCQSMVASGAQIRRTCDLPGGSELEFAALAAAFKARPSKHRLPAPLACIDAVEWSVTTAFDLALAKERALFLQMMETAESRGLRHAFTAEKKSAKIADQTVPVPLRSIHRVGVIGAGTMGSGIAMCFANAGIPVAILETNQQALDRCLATIQKTYDKSAQTGKLTTAQAAQRTALISGTLDYGMLRDADLVVEAVFESLEVKRAVFQQLQAVLKPEAILATNTSALDINTIAGFTERPQDVIGMHFFSPAHVMRLLEVIRADATAPEVLATVMALAKKLGKVAVLAGVCDGFIGNRILARYISTANDLILLGADPQSVDNALEAFGMAMGPFKMGDLVGLDVSRAVRKRRAAENPGIDYGIVADQLCEAGRYGQKNGLGWYQYTAVAGEKPIARPDPAVDQIIADYRRDKSVVARSFSPEEIVERCILAMVNEGARVLEEKIAQRASDIDVVYLNGYGFPKHRGGPMFYAQELGLPQVVKALKKIAQQDPEKSAFWQPAALLERLVRDGKRWEDLV